MGSIMTVLANGFLRSKRNKGRILRYCNTQCSEIDVAHGTARMLVAPANLTMNNVTDGTSAAVSYDATVGSYVDVNLNQHLYTIFGYAEIANCLDKGRSLDALMEGRLTSMFNTVEGLIATLGSTFSTNQGGTINSALTETVYDAARTAIINAQVPDAEALHAFYAPGTNSWVAMTNLANFHEYRITGRQDPHVAQDFGTDASGGIWWKSAYHHESQNVVASTVSGVSGHANFLFHRDAILVAMVDMALPRSPGVEAANFRDSDSGISFQIKRYWDKDLDADMVKIDCLLGLSKGRDEWGALLLS
jgi:hypothetical protein